MGNSQSKLRKAVEEFEAGLIACGIDASNVDYDSLANVRSKLWGELDKIVEAKIAKAATRDYKFITEVIHRLDDSQDNLVDLEAAMGMLKDWQDELAQLTLTNNEDK